MNLRWVNALRCVLASVAIAAIIIICSPLLLLVGFFLIVIFLAAMRNSRVSVKVVG